MSEKWKKYDIDLSFDEDPDLSFDASLTELSSLYVSDEMIPDLRGSVMQSIAESLPDTHPSVFEQDSLSSTFLPATSAISAATSVGFSAIAESMKPLAAACSAASMKSMAISAGDFCSSFAAITAASKSIYPDVVETAASMTEGFGDILSANGALFEEVARTSDMYDSMLSAAVASVCPVKTAGEMADERDGIMFHMSHIVKAFSELIDSSSFIDRALELSLSGMIEMMKDLGRRSLSRLHEIAHFLLHVLWGAWEKRPHIMEITCHNNVRLTTSFVNIGLSPPEQVREYVVQIRHKYLHKHQRKSDNSEDMNDSILLLIS